MTNERPAEAPVIGLAQCDIRQCPLFLSPGPSLLSSCLPLLCLATQGISPGPHGDPGGGQWISQVLGCKIGTKQASHQLMRIKCSLSDTNNVCTPSPLLENSFLSHHVTHCGCGKADGLYKVSENVSRWLCRYLRKCYKFIFYSVLNVFLSEIIII